MRMNELLKKRRKDIKNRIFYPPPSLFIQQKQWTMDN